MWGFGLGGAHSLELIPHVALLGLLRFWEVPVHILYGEQWPGGDKLVGHACLFYFQSIRRRYFIVYYLVSRYYALLASLVDR